MVKSEEKTVDYGGDICFHCAYDQLSVAFSANYMLLSTLVPAIRLFRPGQIQIRLIAFQYFPGCHHLSLTQIMRQFRREADLLTLLKEHFHLEFLGIPAIS